MSSGFTFPTLSQINQEINTINYDWKNPKTYAAILVPVISLYVQKTTLGTVPLTAECTSTDLLPTKYDELRSKVVRINQAHAIGSAAQMVGLFAIASVFSSSIFFLLSLTATYQFYFTVTNLGKERISFYNSLLTLTIPKPY